MRFAITLIAANVISIASVICAGVMALHDKSGWGWFLLVAVGASTSVKTGHTK